MLRNDYDFFADEFKKYEQILLEYKKDNTKIFVDPNFHPTNKIDEAKFKDEKDLYRPAITWRRIDEVYQEPLFKKDLIHPLYIKQGSIGDCYFITALDRLAKKPELVQTLFEKELPDQIFNQEKDQNPDSINLKSGAVVIYFRVFGRRTPVLIDTLIPFNGSEPYFSRPINRNKSAWFCLVEKAFAKLNGSYTNIISGFFSESFYSLFGYYKKAFNYTPDITKNTLKILQYQYRGCLMDAAISTDDDAKTRAAEGFNLVTGHSYLMMKVRKHDGKIFFQLRNPWGHKEWSGDFSKDSQLWTPELEQVLHNDQQDGRFWIPEKDFFTHFTESDVAKPIDPHWTMRMFSFKPPPSKDSGKNKLSSYHNFAFHLLKDVPSGMKARVRILVEKRNTKYSELRLGGSYIIIYLGRNGGQKLTKHDIYDIASINATISTKVTSKNDIVTFVIVHQTQKEIESTFYVNVFCEYDFALYEVGHPDQLFMKGETRSPVLDNFSITSPNAAQVLKPTIIDGKMHLIPKNPTASDFKNQENDRKYEIIIKNLIEESKASTYNITGPQINLDNYIFNNELVGNGMTTDVYTVTERGSGRDLAAIISLDTIQNVLEGFKRKVCIMMELKYPSIINFIGFSENDFSHQHKPMIITELYTGKTLSSALESKNPMEKLTNTKKMINLIGIAFGMKYLHKHNIIHRYLRCSNILLDSSQQPKISGLSTARINVCNNEQYGESPPFYFLAPELADGARQYSFAVDVFAFGMLFYHVISNKEPMIEHRSKLDFLIKISNGAFPSLDDIPNKFHAFIRHMCDRDPTQRPTFDYIIDKLLHSRDECWLEGVDEQEIERYIHQFGATLKPRNATEYIDIINRIHSKLPSNIPRTIRSLTTSTLMSNRKPIIELAKTLYGSSSNKSLIEMSIDLGNIASDLNSTEGFIFLGEAYKNGRGVRKNLAIAASNFKIAGDLGEVTGMFEYARILQYIYSENISHEERSRMLNEARTNLCNVEGKNSYFYEESRLCFDTIENKEMSQYVSKKYFEKASKKGHQKSIEALANINRTSSDISFPPPYFKEFCQELTTEMINNQF